eukprot:gb/GEZN01000984.1/.p1 GENE.gb/GEZN01000984.1/~~gb/GEZN01000984.1/.p1  ORF type:complete len:1013 (+),score=154.93 gb/GEZN01000984.1/:49-3039(+)
MLGLWALSLWSAVDATACSSALQIKDKNVVVVDLFNLTDYLFIFTDGQIQATWQGRQGFVGDVIVDVQANRKTVVGSPPPYAGNIWMNGINLGGWSSIIQANSVQASWKTDAADPTKVDMAKSSLAKAFTQIDALPATTNFEELNAQDLHGFDSMDGIAQLFVCNMIGGFDITTQIEIKGDKNDFFILRWDNDRNPLNGYQGTVSISANNAGIIPKGALLASNFIHVAGDIAAPDRDPALAVLPLPSPYPPGPRILTNAGLLSSLIEGGRDWQFGSSFFTGYWLVNSKKAISLKNAVFVGGWYTNAVSFFMADGVGGGLHVCPRDFNLIEVGVLRITVSEACQNIPAKLALYFFLMVYVSLGAYCTYVTLVLIPYLRGVSINKQLIVKAAQLLILVHSLVAVTCVFRALACLRYAGFSNSGLPSIMRPGFTVLWVTLPCEIMLFLFTRVTTDWASITRYAMDRKMQRTVRKLFYLLNGAFFLVFVALMLIVTEVIPTDTNTHLVTFCCALMALLSLIAGLSFSYYAIIVVNTIEMGPAQKQSHEPSRRIRGDRFPDAGEVEPQKPEKPPMTLQAKTIQRMKVGAILVGVGFVTQAVIWLVTLSDVYDESQGSKQEKCVVGPLTAYWFAELMCLYAVLRIYRLKLESITTPESARDSTGGSSPRQTGAASKSGRYAKRSGTFQQSEGSQSGHSHSSSVTGSATAKEGNTIDHSSRTTPTPPSHSRRLLGRISAPSIFRASGQGDVGSYPPSPGATPTRSLPPLAHGRYQNDGLEGGPAVVSVSVTMAYPHTGKRVVEEPADMLLDLGNNMDNAEDMMDRLDSMDQLESMDSVHVIASPSQYFGEGQTSPLLWPSSGELEGNPTTNHQQDYKQTPSHLNIQVKLQLDRQGRPVHQDGGPSAPVTQAMEQYRLRQQAQAQAAREGPSQREIDAHPEVAAAMQMWRNRQQQQQEQNGELPMGLLVPQPGETDPQTLAQLEAAHPEVAAAMELWRKKQQQG